MTIDKRYYRDLLKYIVSIIMVWLYIPHMLIYFFSKNRSKIASDLEAMSHQIKINISTFGKLIFFLHNKRFYRSLFYYRIGPIPELLISWYRPADKLFTISKTCNIGYGFDPIHPYATVINADKIGNNFRCLHLTTLGKIGEKRPVIGNNVICGANVTIIGGITIGDNVEIGAGSVVTKDIPANCIIAGVPAKVLRKKFEY